MKSSRLVIVALAFALSLLGATTVHLELTASFPRADAELETAPSEIWLEFSAEPDLEQTGFLVRGPDGFLELGEIQVGENPETIQAAVNDAMPRGDYQVSWTAAPVDDHSVRGRFSFTVGEAR